jgi:RNA polymerase sigma-70 factor (ECF subfamily)
VARKRTAQPIEIEAIYRDRFPAFVLSVTAVLGDGQEALDIVQEGFSRALARRRSFRGEGSLEGWIWRIVLNLAKDRHRRSKQARLVHFEPQQREADARDDLIRVQLRALPERQRLAVFLRYYAGLSYEQIAEVLDVRPGTVAASLNAAHRTLRNKLEEVAT